MVITTILYIALAAFAAYVLLLLWSVEKPAARHEVPVRTSGAQPEDREPTAGGLFGGNLVWWAMFGVGAAAIVAISIPL